MKTKLFDRNLYIEGLNQLKTAGLICFLISIIGNILSFISTCIIKYIAFLNDADFLSELFSVSTPYGSTDGVTFISTSAGTNAIYFFTPIFTFLLFKFLFKRNSSDFYHSLSVKRETLFCTFSLAALTVSISIVAVCGLFSIVANGFILGVLDFSSIIPNFLNTIAGCLLMQSAITIGCAVSGRFFASLVASLMIVFYPRIFMTALLYTIKLSIPVIDPTRFDMPLGNSYNVLTGAVFDNYMEYKSVIYSVILATIYYMIAVRFFKNRNSENAHVAGTAKQIKAPMRIAFCLIFCLPAIIIEYLMLTQNYDTDTNLTLIIPILILYFFAIVSYFLIELFSQGKYKNFGKIVLQFGWVVLINVLLVGGLYVSREVVINYTPTAKTIEKINVRPKTDFFETSMNNYDTEEFFDNAYITNKDAIELICEKYNTSKPKADDKYRYLSVGFNEGKTTKYRVISVTKKEYKQLVEYIDINNDYMNKLTTVPETIVSANIPYADFSDNNPMVAKIYEAAANEIKSYSDSEIFNKLMRAVDNYLNICGIYCYDENGNEYVVPYIESLMNETRYAYDCATTYDVTDQTLSELEYSLTHPYVEMDKDYYNERYVYCKFDIDGFYCDYEFKENKTKELFEYIKTEGKVYKEDKILFSIDYDFCRKVDEEATSEETEFSLFNIDTLIENGYGYDTVHFFIDQEHIDEYFTLVSKEKSEYV